MVMLVEVLFMFDIDQSDVLVVARFMQARSIGCPVEI